VGVNQGITWQDYEDALLQQLKHEFEPSGFKVCGTDSGKKHYQKGRFSLVRRQLDVAVYRLGENMPFLIADAKSFNKELNVKDVECFLGMMDDVGAKIGLLAAPKGFSPAATRRANAANLVVKIMSVEESLNYKWIPVARAIYPWDWVFHLELSKSIRHLHEGGNPTLIIESLEGIAFEEWEAFVEYALLHHNREAVQMLLAIALHHSEDGWRYNAIQKLAECGELSNDLAQKIHANEQGVEILQFVNDYRDGMGIE
jgi:hypothetical protein